MENSKIIVVIPFKYVKVGGRLRYKKETLQRESGSQLLRYAFKIKNRNHLIKIGDNQLVATLIDNVKEESWIHIEDQFNLDTVKI